MKARIFKPDKNAMQSGRAKTAGWTLEYVTETARTPESLMGWVSSGDTLNQVRLNFETREEAVRFAEEKGWSYTILAERARKVKARNYTDNFRYVPPEAGDKKA